FPPCLRRRQDRRQERNAMSPVAFRTWLMLGGVSVFDLFWCAAQRLVVSEWQPFLLVAAALAALSVAARRLVRLPRLAGIAEWSLLWLVFLVAGAVLTYAAATRGGALYDRELAALDRALGFDWRGWLAVVNGHPALKSVLWAGYNSMFSQAILSLAWFTWTGREQRNAELI